MGWESDWEDDPLTPVEPGGKLRGINRGSLALYLDPAIHQKSFALYNDSFHDYLS